MTFKGSVTIDDMPIPLDWKHQLHDFLSVRLPPEEMLFSRHYYTPKINPLTCDNASHYLTPPYPPLPPIDIGEYQCPMGMSRYGRALFVVDWPVLKKIAEKCWGWSAPKPLDVPSDWKTPTGDIADARVDLKFSNGKDEFLVKNMIPLPPHRIPGSKVDLWLLPLVDRRYRLKNEVVTEIDGEAIEADPEADPPVEAVNGWNVFFGTMDFANEFEVHDDYLKPDERLTKLEVPQPLSSIADVAALSVGMRIIFDPTTDTIKLTNSAESKLNRAYRLAAPNVSNPNEESPISPMVIAGGRTGAAAYPNKAKIYFKRSDAVSSEEIGLPRTGINTSQKITVFTSWEEGDEEDAADQTDAFLAKVASDLWYWCNSGGQYCFVGIVKPLRTVITDPEGPEPEATSIAVNGFDDYFSIQIQEHPKSTDGTDYVFTHRFYELPPFFLPPVVLAGGMRNTDCGGGGLDNGTIEGVLTGLRTEEEGPYAGKKIATIEVTEAPCKRKSLMPTVTFNEETEEVETSFGAVDVVDHSGCIFDHPEEDLMGVRVWASERISVNPDYDPREEIDNPEYDPECEGDECPPEKIPNPDYDPEKYTPCHWAADDRCCVDADSSVET